MFNIEVKCPFCEVTGGLMSTHAHMAEAHLGLVITQHDPEADRMTYSIACPYCEHIASSQVKPRNRNPRFLQEYKAEIAMVAFDQILYHVLGEHPADVGIDPAVLGLDSDSDHGKDE
ncbi:MAG: hypothetical protein OEZ02_02410 [Anaerolineae bacterium]|nr:hypothetical protein [Anaerolineae bacterium]